MLPCGQPFIPLPPQGGSPLKGFLWKEGKQNGGAEVEDSYGEHQFYNPYRYSPGAGR
jgi:hypothetical protein